MSRASARDLQLSAAHDAQEPQEFAPGSIPARRIRSSPAAQRIRSRTIFGSDCKQSSLRRTPVDTGGMSSVIRPLNESRWCVWTGAVLARRGSPRFCRLAVRRDRSATRPMRLLDGRRFAGFQLRRPRAATRRRPQKARYRERCEKEKTQHKAPGTSRSVRTIPYRIPILPRARLRDRSIRRASCDHRHGHRPCRRNRVRSDGQIRADWW